jgi:hypothetical protein
MIINLPNMIKVLNVKNLLMWGELSFTPFVLLCA